MPDRRSALVESGVELALHRCFQDLLASVDTRSITSAAGVTTGSFFHHFRNRAEFTDAVIERFQELWTRSTQRTVDLLETFSTDEGDMRTAASTGWSGLSEEVELAGIQHLLWVARESPISPEATLTGADVLCAQHHVFDETLVPAYERGLRSIRREMVPPFTVHELSIALSALATGLEMRASVDPDAVRSDLFTDLVSVFVTTITRPASERVEEADAPDVGRVERPSGPLREPTRGTRDQVAEAAAPLFASRRVGEVKIAEIAEVAGVSPSTVYHQFGRVSAVAAASWVQHLPELEAIATEPLTTREGPVVRLEQLLTRFIQIARENRGALEGLVLETVAGASEGHRRAVAGPIGSLIAAHVRELRTRGVLRRRIDSSGLARSIMQLTAMRVLADADASEERIIDETLGVLLEGALARTER